MSRGDEGVTAPAKVGQNSILGAVAKFFGLRTAAKNEKINIFFCLLNEKIQFILSCEMKCPKYRFKKLFKTNFWVG